MDEVDRRLTAETIAALTVPFEHHRDSLNKARTVSGERVRPNDSVELQDGSFLRIVFITKDDDGTKLLHGIRLLRNEEVDRRYSDKLGHDLKALLPCDRNELCAIIKTTTDTDALDAFFVSEPLRGVRRKRNIILTNTVPNWGETPVASNVSSQDSNQDRTLFCRYKYIEKADVKTQKIDEFQLRRLSRTESDVEYGIAPFWLLHHHRSGQDRFRNSNEQYTYGDICAGGGGTSRAAVLASLTPRFLLDNDANACATLRLNFGPEVVLETDVCDFCQLKESGLVVDVLHLSYVCKGHSAANRHENPERDAEHIALGYTLSDILRMCRPRVVTMVRAVPASHFEYAVIYSVVSHGHRNKSRELRNAQTTVNICEPTSKH
jgi:DNA (cytosine-5)-methyltransferase 1